MFLLQGISLLEVKNHLMLSYLADLTCLMGKKVQGESIENDESILRLVEIRTVSVKNMLIFKILNTLILRIPAIHGAKTTNNQTPLVCFA